MVEHGRRKRCAGRQRALRSLPHLTPAPHERFELRCCRLCRAGSRPMLPEAEGDISPDRTGKTAFVRKGKHLRGGDVHPARGYGVRHAPGPPLRRETRQGKLASRALSMFRAGRRASPALRRGRPGRAQTQRASLQHARAAGHELALPQQAAPSPTLPGQPWTMKKVFGASRRRSASTRLLSQLLPITIPGNTRRTAAARRFPRHLSRFLRSPWTAFSFLA